MGSFLSFLRLRIRPSATTTPNESRSPPNEEDLCPLELLQRDVFWLLLDHLPSISKVRMGSRTLRSRVDEYVLLRFPCPPLENVVLSCRKTPGDCEMISMWVKISNRDSKNFARRLVTEHSAEFTKHLNVYRRDELAFVVYELIFNVPNEEYILLIRKYLDAHMGGEILNGVTVSSHNYIRSLVEILEPFLFDKLNVNIDILSDDSVSDIVKALTQHDVAQLCLHVRLQNDSTDSAGFLLRISTLVQSLKIEELREYGYRFGDAFPKRVKPLLGSADAARIIPEMFSGKMNKLCLFNCWLFDKRTTAVDALCESLSNLEKSAWFSATCGGLISECSYARNGYAIQVGHTRDPLNRFYGFNVKHESRVEEPFEL